VRPNPQYPSFDKLVAPPNAGLLHWGEAGAQAVQAVRSRLANQPIRNASNGNDSLFVVLTGIYRRGIGALHGYGGDDRLEGSSQADSLFGDAGNDELFGRGGDDRLEGADGNDVLEGGRGRDLLLGGPGADTLTGGFGADRLRGGDGPDVLLAVDGRRDSVDCGAGCDRAEVDRIDRVTGCETVDAG
jgi:Ca2+-binding RTX toxin-like protein